MKKSIIVIMCVLTFSLFLMQYSLTNHENFDTVVYGEKKLGSYYLVQLPHSILKNESNEIVKNIENIFDQYNASFFITKSENQHYFKYVYVNETEKYEEILNVDSIYNADTHNKNIRNKIEQFDDSYRLTIKDLSEIEKDGFQLEGEAIIFIKDTTKYKDLKRELESNLSIEIKDISLSSGQIDMMPWIILSIFAFYLVLILLVTYDLFKRFKTFSIYKLNGYSSFTIWKDYIIHILSIQFIVSFIGYFLLTIIKCQRYNDYVQEFLINGFCMLGILMIFTFIICSIIMYRFTKVKAIDFLKNRNISNKFMFFNQLILLCVVLITIVLSSIGINKGYAIISRFNNYDEWEKTKNYYILSEMTNVADSTLFSTHEFLNKQKELYKEFNQLGSILADFNEYDQDTINDTSMAYVNVNYVKDQHIKDSHGKDIEISEDESKRVVLVPENTPLSKEQILNMTEGMYDISQGLKIICYKDNQKFFTFNSQITDGYSNMLSHPIVQVLTNNNGKESDYDIILGYKYNPYKIKGNKTTINQILEKYNLSQYIDKYITAYDEMSMLNHNEIIIVIAVMIVLITLITLILVILIQNINIYISHNIKRISIQTMNGYSFVDKYKPLILMSIGTLLLSFIMVLMLSYPLDYLIISYLAISCLWCFVFKVKANYQEKKSIILMLKGGQ